MNEDVEKALEVMDSRWGGYSNAKAIIRQALRDQDAEIARLSAFLGHVVASHTGDNRDGCDMSNSDIDRIITHLGAPHDQA